MRYRGFRQSPAALILVLFLLLTFSPAAWAGGAKYVFLFIGDGMGLAQRTAAEMFTGEHLLMDTFPAQGLTSTHAHDRFITDSAAAGTALATGRKTDVGRIGVSPDLEPMATMAERARDQGRKIGIISSVGIDNATPAAFYAHVKSRRMLHEIDHALAVSGFDFFGGGGMVDPTGNRSKHPRGNALRKARKNDYRIVDSKADFQNLKPGDGKVLAWNARLPDHQSMPYALETTDADISLAEFTAKAIEMLDNEKGFFLMVEGGKIDWACHANDAATAIRDILALDRAVAEAVAFAENHPADTLIVVTADHETGGLTPGFAGTKYDTHPEVLAAQKVSFLTFSEEILPAFQKSKAKDFAAIQPVITEHFGLKFSGDPDEDRLVLTPYEQGLVHEAFDQSMARKVDKTQENALRYGRENPLTVTLTRILNQKAGLGWTTFVHTGIPVPTSAKGVGAEAFNGAYDNTELAKKLMRAMDLTVPAAP